MNIEKEAIKRILVIKLRAVGDVLLSTIVLRNLRLAFPVAKITFLTEPPARDVLKNSPDVDEVLLFDRASMSGFGLIWQVRQRRFQLVIDLFCNPRTALVTFLSGSRYRVGYRFRGRSYAYNILALPRGGEVHNTQFNLDALERIGVDIQDRNVYFHVTHEDLLYAGRFLDQAELTGKFLVALNAGGGWYTKRWPLERFAEIGDRIVSELGAHIVLPWGPGQIEEVRAVASLMKNRPFIPPPTTLPQLGALLKACTMIVTNDSGPMHIAAAVGTPVVGIYGPTNPSLQGPYGNDHIIVRNEELSCLGCNLTTCPIGHPCMEELDVDRVMTAVKELTRRNRSFQ